MAEELRAGVWSGRVGDRVQALATQLAAWITFKSPPPVTPGHLSRGEGDSCGLRSLGCGHASNVQETVVNSSRFSRRLFLVWNAFVKLPIQRPVQPDSKREWNAIRLKPWHPNVLCSLHGSHIHKHCPSVDIKPITNLNDVI